MWGKPWSRSSGSSAGPDSAEKEGFFLGGGPLLPLLWGKGQLDVRVGVCGYSQYLKGLARETKRALLSSPGGGAISAHTSLPAQRLELSLGCCHSEQLHLPRPSGGSESERSQEDQA